MKYTQVIAIFAFIIIASIVMHDVSAQGLCLQQQANNSTVGDGNCTLNYNGTYYVEQINGTYTGFVYMNYTVPDNTSLNSSLWNIKFGVYNNTPIWQNASISNCAIVNNILQLRTYSHASLTSTFQTTGNSESYGACYNGVGWSIITNDSTYSGNLGGQYAVQQPAVIFDASYGTDATYINSIYSGVGSGWYNDNSNFEGLDYGLVYEESMYWNISNTSTNPQANLTVNITQPNCSINYTANSSGIIIPISWYLLYGNFTNITYDVTAHGVLQDIPLINAVDISSYNWTVTSSNINAGDYYIGVVSSTTNNSASADSCTFNICVNNWQPNLEPCTNGLKLSSYYDANHCSASYDIPSDNGTYIACSNPQVISYDSTTITYIVLGLLLILGIVLGIAVHALFLGFAALVMAYLDTIFIINKFNPAIYVLGMIFTLFLIAFMFIKWNHDKEK